MIILLYLCMPAFLIASQEQEPSYKIRYQQLIQKSNDLLKANQEKRASEWKDIKKLENNVREAIMRFMLRCAIDHEFLTQEQEMHAAMSTTTIMGPLISEEEDGKIISKVKAELKQAIEQDTCGGVEWRDQYGKTPENMTPPTPKTLRASRLKALERFH